jgi:hypothetical protein
VCAVLCAVLCFVVVCLLLFVVLTLVTIHRHFHKMNVNYNIFTGIICLREAWFLMVRGGTRLEGSR